MAKNCFSKILISIVGVKIEDKNEKICSRFNETMSHKIDSTIYGLHRDHPPAWELKFEKKIKPFPQSDPLLMFDGCYSDQILENSYIQNFSAGRYFVFQCRDS